MSTQPQMHVIAEGNITSDAMILGETPVLAGIRVPVSALFDYLADNVCLDYFLETFPTAALGEQAVAVIRFD